MRRLWIVPLALVMCLGGTGYANAVLGRNYVPPSRVYDEGGRMMLQWIGAIGLGEDQTAAVKGVYFRTMKEGIRKKADMDVAEVELRELFLKEPADFKAVEAKVRQIEKLRGDLFILHMRSRDEVRSLLTAEQRRRFDALAAAPSRSATAPATCERDRGRRLGRDGGLTGMRPEEDTPAWGVDPQSGEMPDMDGSE